MHAQHRWYERRAAAEERKSALALTEASAARHSWFAQCFRSRLIAEAAAASPLYVDESRWMAEQLPEAIEAGAMAGAGGSA
jgi:hypothetical protein